MKTHWKLVPGTKYYYKQAESNNLKLTCPARQFEIDMLQCNVKRTVLLFEIFCKYVIQAECYAFWPCHHRENHAISIMWISITRFLQYHQYNLWFKFQKQGDSWYFEDVSLQSVENLLLITEWRKEFQGARNGKHSDCDIFPKMCQFLLSKCHHKNL